MNPAPRFHERSFPSDGRGRAWAIAGAGAVGGAVLIALVAATRTAAPAASDAMVERGGPDCNAAIVERTAWLMGTSLRATVCAPTREAGLEAIEMAFASVRDVEARLSTWRPDSELSRLNAARPDAWVPLSPFTVELLEQARRLGAATGGAFDAAAGAAIDAWDLRGSGRVPGPRQIETARGRAGPHAWELDGEAGRARRRTGVRLDAGGFGKGAGLRRAADDLAAADLAWFVLDFGGQLSLWSADPGTRWPVAVADPRRRDRPAVVLWLGPGSVATTAASERFVETEEGRQGHVVDPRTARPVPAWGSATVVARDPVTADALSTALFVMGRERGLAWSRESGAAALLLEAQGAELELYRSPGLDAVASTEPIPENRRGSRS